MKKILSGSTIIKETHPALSLLSLLTNMGEDSKLVRVLFSYYQNVNKELEALLGCPLYSLTPEAISTYLKDLKADLLASIQTLGVSTEEESQALQIALLEIERSENEYIEVTHQINLTEAKIVELQNRVRVITKELTLIIKDLEENFKHYQQGAGQFEEYDEGWIEGDYEHLGYCQAEIDRLNEALQQGGLSAANEAELESELTSAWADYESIEAKINSYRSYGEKLGKDLRKLDIYKLLPDSSIDELKSVLKSARKKLKNSEFDEDALQEVFESLSEAIEDVIEELTEVEGHYQELNEDKHTYSSVNKEYANESKALQERFCERKGEIESLEASVMLLVGDLSELFCEANSLEQVLDELDKGTLQKQEAFIKDLAEFQQRVAKKQIPERDLNDAKKVRSTGQSHYDDTSRISSDLLVLINKYRSIYMLQKSSGDRLKKSDNDEARAKFNKFIKSIPVDCDPSKEDWEKIHPIFEMIVKTDLYRQARQKTEGDNRDLVNALRAKISAECRLLPGEDIAVGITHQGKLIAFRQSACSDGFGVVVNLIRAARQNNFPSLEWIFTSKAVSHMDSGTAKLYSKNPRISSLHADWIGELQELPEALRAAINFTDLVSPVELAPVLPASQFYDFQQPKIEPKIDDIMSDPEIQSLYMGLAFELATNPVYGADHKIATIIVDKSGEILSWGVNKINSDPTFHAEVNAIQAYLTKSQKTALPDGVQIFTTLKSCSMCAGCIMDQLPENGHVYYAQNDPGEEETALKKNGRETAFNHEDMYESLNRSDLAIQSLDPTKNAALRLNEEVHQIMMRGIAQRLSGLDPQSFSPAQQQAFYYISSL